MADRGSTFSRGKNALAECPRCGMQVPYPQLRKDGQNKNYVCRDCWDPKHPQEMVPKDIYDPVALRHPRKDRAQNDESFLLERSSLVATAFIGRFTVT